MLIFAYPEDRHLRRHGPSGYANYRSFRPWLRDEFAFRCVYCLKREQWGQVTGDFELDHFEPQSCNPGRKLDYTNLVYACRRCNSVKLDQAVEDPFLTFDGKNVVTDTDGTVKGADPPSQRLILQLDLNSPRLVEWRLMWMRIVMLAKQRDNELYGKLIGFPDELPDLSRLTPPINDRPEGIADSWFAKRRRGELPSEY